VTGATVIWHDLECGAYRQDIALWLGLAAEFGAPVLDVGAGTGRVALELARAGHEVVAIDRDPELLQELERRGRGLPLRAVLADARSFSLSDRFPLCVVPMQTIQLLGGEQGRAEFLACARRHLLPGGALAIAIAEQLELFEVRDGEAGPLADMRELDGVLYSSRPTAVRRDGRRFRLERRRETVAPGGERHVSLDRIDLDAVSARELAAEGSRHGLRSAGVRRVAPTAEHVGSQVVMLRA
jgi:SAM-dependent methyltransferase